MAAFPILVDIGKIWNEYYLFSPQRLKMITFLSNDIFLFHSLGEKSINELKSIW